ncbi:MAG: hypothetical protein P8Y76_05610, partial [bacterium]
IVEVSAAQPAAAQRFAAYAVVQNQDDPYAKAIQEMMAHSHELEDSVVALTRKLAELEKELAEHEAQSPPPENLRAVK